jgi:hypothetical protein
MQGFYNCNHFFDRVNQKIRLLDFFFPSRTSGKNVAGNVTFTSGLPPPSGSPEHACGGNDRGVIRFKT